jgi:hypothetical protein
MGTDLWRERRLAKVFPFPPRSVRGHRFERRGLESRAPREGCGAFRRVKNVAPFDQDSACDVDRVSKGWHGADGAHAQRRALHDGSVELDETLLRQTCPRSGIEQRIILEHAHTRLDGIERRGAAGKQPCCNRGGPPAPLDAIGVRLRAPRSTMHEDRPAGPASRPDLTKMFSPP